EQAGRRGEQLRGGHNAGPGICDKKHERHGQAETGAAKYCREADNACRDRGRHESYRADIRPPVSAQSSQPALHNRGCDETGEYCRSEYPECLLPSGGRQNKYDDAGYCRHDHQRQYRDTKRGAAWSISLLRTSVTFTCWLAAILLANPLRSWVTAGLAADAVMSSILLGVTTTAP